ncbi:hypothetical protein EC991_008423 [Linnemannia zychae]|nr:hypothetical protein EC991_008423 [Linnemannia zychae]
MATLGTHTNAQAVRRAYEDEEVIDNTTLGRTIYIATHSDASSGRDIILWDDVLAAFKEDVIHIRTGALVLPFLKGPDFKNLDPLRLAAIPDATLDVIVKGQRSVKKALIETSQKPLPNASKGSDVISVTTTNGTPVTTRRNPVGGLVEKAMDAYRDNENPAFGPRLRGPQALLDETSPSVTSETPPASQESIPSPETPSPQESTTNSNAFQGTMERAKLGDKEIQFALGEMYYYAKGVQQSYSAAMEWYLKAANQGHTEAQNYIGLMHQHGRGVPRDYVAAMEWYRKAANEGHAVAQSNVAWIYKDGLGVPKNREKAIEWYKKAVAGGFADAQQFLDSLEQQQQQIEKGGAQEVKKKLGLIQKLFN